MDKDLAPSNKEILSANYSFVVLRNPFKRLLSFFLDKICHITSTLPDGSYDAAKKLFQTDEKTSFAEFIDSIYHNPDIINFDLHTKPQCDFLIYNKYRKYYQFENYNKFQKDIFKKIGLKIVDIRDINTIHTTKGLEFSEAFSPNMPISEIRSLMESGGKPIPEKFFTNDMIRKIGAIYFADIMLYHNLFSSESQEMADWMSRMICTY